MAQQAEIEQYTGTEVISRDEAKAYLRVATSDDDDYIDELIKIARLQVFNDTNTAVVETEVTEYFEKWPINDCITLRYAGKLKTCIVYYYDSSNSLDTLTLDTDYRKIDYQGMPKVEFINKPTLYDRKQAIKIHYHVEPTNDDTIRTLKIAMYMLIQHYYDNRSPVSYLKVEEMPLGYKNIINQYKNYMWK